MESTCLNLDGVIESFPDIGFEKQNFEISTIVNWLKRPDVCWELTPSYKEDPETYEYTYFFLLTGPFFNFDNSQKHLKINFLPKPKKFSGRNALGRVIKFIKNYEYKISQ